MDLRFKLYSSTHRELVWDEELAVVAQRWADQCMPGHDHRRNVGM